MNNEIFSRLINLFSMLGLSVEEGAYARAEAAAYACAAQAVLAEMENTEKNLFIDSAGTQGLALFLNLIGKNHGESDEKTRELVVDSVSKGFSTGSMAAFEHALRGLGEGTEYEADGSRLVLKPDTSSADEGFAEKLSDFLRDYAPAFSRVEIDGGGSDFAARDAAGRRWFELDGYNMPFSVIDSL